jgi:2-polyprenyl-3-methyl-5-hydroxy-6-metoxy-1,4-benzoquinol methylase
MGSQRGYYEFMGYDTNVLRQRYVPYADRFGAGSRVLDVGCGRGEFLELVAQRGGSPVGVDADEEMVATVRDKGFDAEVGDALGFLRAHPAEFDGVFTAHLVEHLQSDSVAELVQAAAEALRPGGRLIVVTPNVGNLNMHLRDFWIDLQHVRFYAPDILRWVLHDAGLTAIESGENELYTSEHDLSQIDFSAPPDPPAPMRRSLRSRARQRLAEWLEPASSLERIQRLEADVLNLSQWLAGLFPPAEIWVSGVRR